MPPGPAPLRLAYNWSRTEGRTGEPEQAGVMMTEALNQRLHLLYRLIEDSGLYINLNRDVRFRETANIPLNLNETEYMAIAEESYNSPLLFALLTSVLRNGTMILYGSPGSGKTTSAEFVGALVFGRLLEEASGEPPGEFRVLEAIHEATIHGHQELTEEKMIGRPHLGKLMRQGEEEIIPRRFMLSPFRMVDEVNRLTPGRTNNLLEMMDRGFSVYGDEKIYAAEGATFLTANFRDVASSDLTPPFLDRIDVGVFAPTLNPYFLEMAGGGEDRKLTGDIESYLRRLRAQAGEGFTPDDFRRMRSEIAETPIEPESRYILYNFIAEMNGCSAASPELERKSKGFAWFVKPPVLCSQSDDDEWGQEEGQLGGCHFHNTDNICYKTENEVSVRSGRTIERYARALAWFRGRASASLEDLEAVVPYVLWFKLVPTDRAWAQRPEYMNDRISLVRDLFAASRNHYLKSRRMIQTLDAALELYERGLRGEKVEEGLLLEAMASLKDYDSPAKYPIATMLRQIYLDLRERGRA
jgi:MoxR-like ATPase